MFLYMYTWNPYMTPVFVRKSTFFCYIFGEFRPDSHGTPGPFAWKCSRWSSCVAGKSRAFGDEQRCVTTKSGSNIDREKKFPPETFWEEWHRLLTSKLILLGFVESRVIFHPFLGFSTIKSPFGTTFFADHQRVADLSSAIHDKWQRWWKLLHPIFRRDNRTLSWLWFICFFWGVVVGVPSLKLT